MFRLRVQAPWRVGRKSKLGQQALDVSVADDTGSRGVHAAVPCTWSAAIPNTYLAGCDDNCVTYPTIAAAQAACAADANCGGLTIAPGGLPQLRAGSTPLASPSSETSYYITNAMECHPILPDPAWVQRGAAAYMGLNRTDPDAIWSFQGWAIIDWDSTEQGERVCPCTAPCHTLELVCLLCRLQLPWVCGCCAQWEVCCD